jgi:gas vesicle protein
MAKRLIVAALIGATVGILSGLFVRPDYFPALRTYGVSVGTDTHYCSIDVVSDRLETACQEGN